MDDQDKQQFREFHGFCVVCKHGWGKREVGDDLCPQHFEEARMIEEAHSD